jgi:hypothetical protein
MFGRREKKLCAGPPQAAADVGGGELEVSAMIVEGALQIDKATTEKKNAKTFCYFGTHIALEFFLGARGETSSKMIPRYPYPTNFRNRYVSLLCCYLVVLGLENTRWRGFR